MARLLVGPLIFPLLLCGSASAATLTVTTEADVVDAADGVLSLREALDAAAAGDVVGFDASLSGVPVLLTNGSLTIDTSLDLVGLGAERTVIDAQGGSRVFYVASGADVTLSGLTITGGNVVGDGAGIRHDGGSLLVMDSVIRGNTSTWAGTAISHFFGYDLQVVRCILEDNEGGIGAGIFVNFGTTTVSETMIRNNVGGGIWNLSGDVRVENSSISGNLVHSNDGGAGILNSSGDVDVVSSTISGNQATGQFGGFGSGGGIRVEGGNVRIASSAIVDNSAFVDGGGIATGTPFRPVELRNSIVMGNDAPAGEDCTSAVDVSSLGHNLLGDATGCPSNGAGDQLLDSALVFTDVLAPLGISTGVTETHPLLRGSPALDAGDPAGCTTPDGDALPTDQRGDARQVGSACDVGPFERDPGAFLLSVGGSCPGTTHVTALRGTAGGRVHIVGASGPGVSSVPEGACVGSTLDLADPPTLRRRLTVGTAGDVVHYHALSDAFCGETLQAVDVGTCDVSNLAAVP